MVMAWRTEAMRTARPLAQELVRRSRFRVRPGSPLKERSRAAVSASLRIRSSRRITVMAEWVSFLPEMRVGRAK